MNEREVADYLLSDPDFFARHAELLAAVKLTSPHGNRAISLQERQMEMLREKNKQLDRRLAELMRHGHENDSIVTRLTRWTALIVAERDTHNLPQTVIRSLAEVFEMPSVALRVWDLAGTHAEADYASGVGEEIRLFANGLTLPYCGPNTGFEAAQWLTQAQAAVHPQPTPMALEANQAAEVQTETQAASVALIALRIPAKPAAASADLTQTLVLAPVFGLLVMGSPDPRRFHEGMATDFLEQIGELAGAALSRLLPH
jgi:uncharacterized protein